MILFMVSTVSGEKGGRGGGGVGGVRPRGLRAYGRGRQMYLHTHRVPNTILVRGVVVEGGKYNGSFPLSLASFATPFAGGPRNGLRFS